MTADQLYAIIGSNVVAIAVVGGVIGTFFWRTVARLDRRIDEAGADRRAFQAGMDDFRREMQDARNDFRREMHATRLRVDDLLERGRIEEAEAYMESRRQVFVEEGYPIRKLNQAYFAFYGTYADNPASVSPIGQEVDRLREISGSLGEFVRTMSGFGSYQEFKAHLTLHDGEPVSEDAVP